MHGNCWPLVASLAYPHALGKYGSADRTPTPAVFEMDAAPPVAVIGSAIELRDVLAHAGRGAEHAGLALEVAGGAVECLTAPRTNAIGAAAPGSQRLSGFPSVVAQLRTELPRAAFDGNSTPAEGTHALLRLAPPVEQIATIRAELLLSPIAGMVFDAALLTVQRSLSTHSPSIAEITPLYVEKKPEQTELTL